MKKNTQGGYVTYIAIVVISLALLGYFSADVKGYIDKWVESPTIKTPLIKAVDVAGFAYEKYLKPPAKYIWQNIVLDIVWPTVEKQIDSFREKVKDPNVGVEGVGE